MKQEIRPKKLGEGVFFFGTLFLLALIAVATLATKPHFWESGGLVGVLFLFLLLVITVAVALPFFSRLEWDDDTLTYRGPQMPTQTIQIVDIARINVILIVSRAGEQAFLEFVATAPTNQASETASEFAGTRLGNRLPVPSTKRFRVLATSFNPSDLTRMLQSLKVRNPNIIFDERAECFAQGRPLPKTAP